MLGLPVMTSGQSVSLDAVLVGGAAAAPDSDFDSPPDSFFLLLGRELAVAELDFLESVLYQPEPLN